MLKTLVIVCAAVLAGCAAPKKLIAFKVGGSQAEYERDLAACEYDVAKATTQGDASLRTGLAIEVDRAMRRRDLGVLCMRAKGYQLYVEGSPEHEAAKARQLR